MYLFFFIYKHSKCIASCNKEKTNIDFVLKTNVKFNKNS